MLTSTFDHQQHQQQNKGIRMKNLATKISQLTKSDYDKKVFSVDEIKDRLNSNAAKSLELCHKFGIDASVTASEIVHSKAEIEALKKEKISFRAEGANDEKIAGLEELVSELQAILQTDFDTAQRYETMEIKQKRFDSAVSDIEPLCDQHKEIERALKEKVIKVTEIETSELPNPLDEKMFRLASSMSRPGGVFA